MAVTIKCWVLKKLQTAPFVSWPLKEIICSKGIKFFPLRVDPPIEKVGENENVIVASPESVTKHLKGTCRIYKHKIKADSQTSLSLWSVVFSCDTVHFSWEVYHISLAIR